MRIKKIRGHRRKWEQIKKWRKSNLNLNLEHLENYGRRYCKIRVHPWSGISITNSIYSQPKRRTKQEILKGLIDIYESWKETLDTKGQPYYLKIWLYEPRLALSQVVCAVGENIDFYEKTFNKCEVNRKHDNKTLGALESRIEGFNWECYLDEEHYDNTFVGKPEDYVSYDDYQESKVWFGRLMKRPHKTKYLKEPIGDVTELYRFKQGYVWIGEKK
jgi:hypothetical protein